MLFGIFIAALALGGLYVRTLTPQERTALLHRVLAHLRHAWFLATHAPEDCEAFFDMLRHRTRRVVVTPAIVGVSFAVFFLMCFGAGRPGDPQTQIAWGANFGPRTTNAEWWRLLSALFVHSSVFHLVAESVGILWMGFVLERLVGPVAFGITYLAAGVLAGAADLSAHQAAVVIGSSGAIFGLYGLFLVSMLIWKIRLRSMAAIPTSLVNVLGPGMAIFLLYDFFTQGFFSAGRFAGFVAGLGSGCALAIGLVDRKPSTRRIVTVATSAAVITLLWAVPIRGLTDVTAEITQVIEVESRSADDYGALLDQIKDGRGTIEARIKLIDRIRPQLQELRTQLEGIAKVPREQQASVANALEYLRTRDESWRLRREALRKGNIAMLRQAESLERVSLEAFRRIAPAANSKS